MVTASGRVFLKERIRTDDVQLFIFSHIDLPPKRNTNIIAPFTRTKLNRFGKKTFLSVGVNRAQHTHNSRRKVEVKNSCLVPYGYKECGDLADWFCIYCFEYSQVQLSNYF